MTTTSTSVDAALAPEAVAPDAALPPDSAALDVGPRRWRRRAASLAFGSFIAVCLACFVLSLRAPLGNRRCRLLRSRQRRARRLDTRKIFIRMQDLLR